MFEDWMKGKTIGEICKIKGYTLQEYFLIEKSDDYYGIEYPSKWRYKVIFDPSKNIKVTRSRRVGELKFENEVVEDIPYTEEDQIRVSNEYPDKFQHFTVLPKDKAERYGVLAGMIKDSITKCQLNKLVCPNKDNHHIPGPMDEWQVRFRKRCSCGAELEEEKE